jgi:hypothetical protein
LEVGDWFRIRGLAAGSGANNGRYKILTRTSADEAVVDTQHTNLIDETASGTIESSKLVPGTTFQSFVLEKVFGPTASPTAFHQFYGMVPNGLTIAGEAEGLVTLQHTFLGLSPASTAATVAVGTVTAAPTHRPVRVVGGVKKIYVPGFTGPAIRAQSWSVALTNNGAQDMAHSDSLETSVFDVRLGTMDVTGQGVFYYRDRDLYEAFLAYRDLGLAWDLVAPDNAGYVLDLPLVNLGQCRIQAGGPNQPIVANVSFAVNPSDNYAALYRFPNY